VSEVVGKRFWWGKRPSNLGQPMTAELPRLGTVEEAPEESSTESTAVRRSKLLPWKKQPSKSNSVQGGSTSMTSQERLWRAAIIKEVDDERRATVLALPKRERRWRSDILRDFDGVSNPPVLPTKEKTWRSILRHNDLRNSRSAGECPLPSWEHAWRSNIIEHYNNPQTSKAEGSNPTERKITRDTPRVPGAWIRGRRQTPLPWSQENYITPGRCMVREGGGALGF
jgi:hypothetical protein